MQFQKHHLYHIYNRGNNAQQIFFSRENYFFFLQKLKTYLVPYADILAWCLMPNHFHLMVHVNHIDQVTSSHPVNKSRSINQSFAIALRSYTRALQKEKHFTGSLFQQGTQSICLSEINGISPAWFQTTFGTLIHISDPEKEYPQVCFNYIHNNPVRAGLVKHPSEWEFSSYPDYAGLRNGKLINRRRTKEFGLDINSPGDFESPGESANN